MARTKGSKNKLKQWVVFVQGLENTQRVVATNVRAARKLARDVWGDRAEVGKPEVVSQAAIDTAS